MIQKYAQIWFVIKRSGNSFSTKFYGWLFKRISHHIFDSINSPNFIVWFPSLLEILGNICIAVICYPVCDVRTFEIKLSFLIKPFFYVTKTSGQNVNHLRTKRVLNMKWKVFFITFKGLLLEEIKLTFLEGVSLTLNDYIVF